MIKLNGKDYKIEYTMKAFAELEEFLGLEFWQIHSDFIMKLNEQPLSRLMGFCEIGFKTNHPEFKLEDNDTGQYHYIQEACNRAILKAYTMPDVYETLKLEGDDLKKKTSLLSKAISMLGKRN